MSTVSPSQNPGVANLLQTLNNINSPVLNSKAVISALQKAPASDIVQISQAAAQLQNVTALFGGSSENSDANNLAALFGLPTAATSNTTSVLDALQNAGAILTPAEQTVNAQAALQSELTQGLFGTGTGSNPYSLRGSLLNTLG